MIGQPPLVAQSEGDRGQQLIQHIAGAGGQVELCDVAMNRFEMPAVQIMAVLLSKIGVDLAHPKTADLHPRCGGVTLVSPTPKSARQ